MFYKGIGKQPYYAIRKLSKAFEKVQADDLALET